MCQETKKPNQIIIQIQNFVSAANSLLDMFH